MLGQTRGATAITLCLLIAAGIGAGQGLGQNLPNVGDIQNVGRLKAFVSPRGVTWFFPAAFSSTFKCLDAAAGAKSRICTLVVVNTLQDKEKEELSRFADTVGGAVTHFTDIEPFVKKIDESFQDLPSMVNATPLLLKTLRLAPANVQYASLTQRFTTDQAAQLLSAYGQKGIGTFVSIVSFSAERTNAFVGIRDPAALSRRLADLGPEFNYADVHTAIRDSLDARMITSNNVDLESAKVLIEFFVRGQCLKPNASGSYSLRKPPEECLPKPTIVFDETASPIPTQCTATLPLREAGMVAVACATQ